ncbi:hypothetical protein DX928_13325 [Bacillus swezeyi]|nr:hypothetical protein DX928_13325 [Bacillus swezeyi]
MSLYVLFIQHADRNCIKLFFNNTHYTSRLDKMILQFCFNDDISYRKNAKSARKRVLSAFIETKEPYVS